MEFRTGSLSVGSRKDLEVIDITQEVLKWLNEERLKDGLLTISTRHTTAGLTINEGERGLMHDIKAHLLRLVPKGQGYEHDRVDNNAHAHLITSLLGMTVSIIVRNGKLVLGTWQRILFVECDGPRTRTIELGFVGVGRE